MSLSATLAARLRASAERPVPFAGDGPAIEDAAGGDIADVPAAVLIAIVDRPAPGLLLTRRTDTLRAHAGQVAFPGGRLDPGDADAAAAALREADEEIGLTSAAVAIVGALPDYRTVTGYRVTPVIGVVPPDLPLVPREAEVAALFELPLAFALDPAHRVTRTGEWQGRARTYVELVWGEHRIWGATAAILANLAAWLAP